MSAQPSSPSLPNEELIRKLAGRELDSNIVTYVFEGRRDVDRTSGAWTLDDAKEAEEIVIRKLGLPAYSGALMALLDNDVSQAIVASPQFRLRACLLALKRDSEQTSR